MHSHGKTRYSNEHVDLESLRPDRPDGARLIVLPNINVQGGTRTERVTSLRDQIHHVRQFGFTLFNYILFGMYWLNDNCDVFRVV